MINDKLKVFVRFNQGACGNFIALMVLSLTKSVTLHAPNHGHDNQDDIFYNHNFEHQKNDVFRSLTTYSTTLNIVPRIRKIRSLFEFYPTTAPLYIVPTHAQDPTSLIFAFINTKLITITNTEKDIPQLAYNWVTKSITTKSFLTHINNLLHYIQTTHNRLLNIPLSSLNTQLDLRLLTYIQMHLFSYYSFTDDYKNIRPSKNFTIKFEDIMNKQVIDQLDSLITFLGLSVTEERKQATIQMIHSYVDNQIIIPFDITLDSFN